MKDTDLIKNQFDAGYRLRTIYTWLMNNAGPKDRWIDDRYVPDIIEHAIDYVEKHAFDQLH